MRRYPHSMRMLGPSGWTMLASMLSIQPGSDNEHDNFPSGNLATSSPSEVFSTTARQWPVRSFELTWLKSFCAAASALAFGSVNVSVIGNDWPLNEGSVYFNVPVSVV